MILLLAVLLIPSFARAENLSATEQYKIEALIKHVGDLKDAKFVRNGSTYEPATAVRFLRGKWDANKTGVKTASDFIDKVATKSESSGKPYLLRFSDGKEIPSREFLFDELKKNRKLTQTANPAPPDFLSLAPLRGCANPFDNSITPRR